jgi:hypothetical protein
VDAPPTLEPAARLRRSKRLLIAAAIVLACSFLPWTCNVNVGDHHWAWRGAGPVICGAITSLLALIALARGAHVVLGLALEALGAAALVYGLVTIQRIGGASDADAVTDATTRVFEQLRDHKDDALAADADPALQSDLPIVHRIDAAIVRRFGRWQSIGGVRARAGDDGRFSADGTAHYERGSTTFQLVFTKQGGAPHLAGFEVSVPVDERPTDAAGAEKAARGFVADLAAGAADRATDDLDPRVDLPPSFGDRLAALRVQVGDAPKILLDAQSACGGDQQCFDYVIEASAGKLRVHVVEEPTYGQWLATTFKIGLDGR